MVDRRHLEHAFAGELERHHLHDHRHRLQHEQAADDGEHDLVLDRHRHRAEHAAERQRAGVAHEDRGRRRVEPQEAEAGTDHRAAQHRQFAGAGDVMDLQIVGEHQIAGQIRDQPEARRRDHHRHDRQTVQPVGEVDRIAGADDDEGAEQHESPAEIDHQLLEERKHQRGRDRPLAEMRQRRDGDHRNQRLGQQARAAGKAGVALLGDLQIVVIKADQAEAQRHSEHDPDIRAGRVRPQQGRDQQAGKDHQPAHGGRAFLADQMGLRAVGADRLALALLDAQQVDHRAAEQEDEHQRGDDGAAGAERDVAEDVEKRDLVGEFGQPIKHRVKP